MTDTPKLCVECRHYFERPISRHELAGICRASHDLVGGDEMRCDEARKPWGPCGPEGKLWEAKK